MMTTESKKKNKYLPFCHQADCDCEECEIFYDWWIRKRYNVSQHGYIHNLCLRAFRLGYRKHLKTISQHEKRIKELEGSSR